MVSARYAALHRREVLEIGDSAASTDIPTHDVPPRIGKRCRYFDAANEHLLHPGIETVMSRKAVVFSRNQARETTEVRSGLQLRWVRHALLPGYLSDR